MSKNPGFWVWLPGFVLVALTGCASITEGTEQTVRVETLEAVGGNPVNGAICEFSNDKGHAKGFSGTVTTVRRSGANLAIKCTMPGRAVASGQAVSRANAGMAGNILIGGAIGAAIDAGTGAAYTYPTWMRLVFGQDRLYDRTNHRDDSVDIGQSTGFAAVAHDDQPIAKSGASLTPGASGPPERSGMPAQGIPPGLSDRGREAYQTYLSKRPPKAFVVGPAGRFAWANGYGATQRAQVADPTRRAMESCERISGPGTCVLYSVNGDLTGAAAPDSAPVSAPTVVPTAARGLVAIEPSTQPQRSRYAVLEDSHFADVNDATAVPIRTEGRSEYLRYLALPLPRAFAISLDGEWAVRSASASAAADVLNACERDGRACWLYAVDDHVVWQAEPHKRIGRVSQLALNPGN